MTAYTRRCWWLAVAGCVLFLAALAGATTLQPATPEKRTVAFDFTPDTTPRSIP